MKATPKTDEVIGVLKQIVTVINLIEYNIREIEKADAPTDKAKDVINAYQRNLDYCHSCKVTAKDVYDEYWEICPSVDSLHKCAKAIAVRFENVGIPVWICDPHSDYQKRVNNKIWSMERKEIITKSQASDLMCLFDLLKIWLMVWVFNVQNILKEMGIKPLPLLTTDKPKETGNEENNKPTHLPDGLNTDEALAKLDNPQLAKCQQQAQVDKTDLYNKVPKGKGRPKGTLKDKMICEDVDKMLSKLHQLMNGRKGKDVALIITACIKAVVMIKPTFKQVSDEFGDIGNQSGYNKNMRERPFSDMEIEAIINKLKE